MRSPSQGDLFGPIRTTQSLPAFLRPAFVKGLVQPFEMPVPWGLSFQDLCSKPNVRSVDPRIQTGLVKKHPGGFRIGYYQFMSVLDVTGSAGVEAVCKEGPNRSCWYEEAKGVPERFATFPDDRLIWTLDSEFLDPTISVGLRLYLQYEQDWNFRLASASLGEIKPRDLILTRCLLK